MNKILKKANYNILYVAYTYCPHCDKAITTKPSMSRDWDRRLWKCEKCNKTFLLDNTINLGSVSMCCEIDKTAPSGPERVI